MDIRKMSIRDMVILGMYRPVLEQVQEIVLEEIGQRIEEEEEILKGHGGFKLGADSRLMRLYDIRRKYSDDILDLHIYWKDADFLSDDAIERIKKILGLDSF